MTRELHTINLTSESGEVIVSLMIDNKVIKLKCKSSWEVELWTRGLRNAAETEKILARTQQGVLRFNISVLHGLFSSRRDNDVNKFIGSITSGLVSSLKPAQFAAEFRAVAKEVSSLADAFYAYRPFVLAFFKFVMTGIHAQIRSQVCNYWNQYFEIFQASDVLAFGAAFCAYERTMTAWGVIDYKFAWQEPVQTTYVSRVFENSKGPITNIIGEFERNTFSENGKLHSSVCPALESHVYFLLGGHAEVPLNSFAEKLSLLVNKVLQAVLIQLVYLLVFKEYPAKIYIAILNNYFLKMVKNFEKKIHGDTRSQISLKSIKDLIGEGPLLELMARVEGLSLKRLKRLWRGEVLGRFGTDQTFFDYDLEEKMSLLITAYENDLKLVVLKCHIDELLYELFDTLLTVYYGKFANVCESVTVATGKRVAEILGSDYKALQRFFEIHSFDRSAQILQKFRQLKTFFETDDLDECVASLLNMTVFMEGLVNEQSIGRLMRCKVHFPDASIQYALAFFEKAIRADERQLRAHKRAFYSIFLNRYLQRVVIKFRTVTRRAEGQGAGAAEATQDGRGAGVEAEAGLAADRLRPSVREQGVGQPVQVRRQGRRPRGRGLSEKGVSSPGWSPKRRRRSPSFTSFSRWRASSSPRTRPARARWSWCPTRPSAALTPSAATRFSSRATAAATRCSSTGSWSRTP